MGRFPICVLYQVWEYTLHWCMFYFCIPIQCKLMWGWIKTHWKAICGPMNVPALWCHTPGGGRPSAGRLEWEISAPWTKKMQCWYSNHKPSPIHHHNTWVGFQSSKLLVLWWVAGLIHQFPSVGHIYIYISNKGICLIYNIYIYIFIYVHMYIYIYMCVYNVYIYIYTYIQCYVVSTTWQCSVIICFTCTLV